LCNQKKNFEKTSGKSSIEGRAVAKVFLHSFFRIPTALNFFLLLAALLFDFAKLLLKFCL